MPAYVTRSVNVNNVDVIWSESSSNFDISGRYISIPDAQIGHIHFHVNQRAQRVQSWVLEKRSWEEHYINLRNLRDDYSLEELVRQGPWDYIILCARNFAAV